MMVVLLGYMGSGKSLIGELLAKKMNCKFQDLDALIEIAEGQSVSRIFSEKGEIYFRKIEAQILRENIKTNDAKVLALGGGTPCYAANMDAINKSEHCISVYLSASINTLANRLMAERDKRPLLQHVASLDDMMEFIGKHLFERNTFYNQAKIKITTDQKSPTKIVEEILELI